MNNPNDKPQAFLLLFLPYSCMQLVSRCKRIHISGSAAYDISSFGRDDVDTRQSFLIQHILLLTELSQTLFPGLSGVGHRPIIVFVCRKIPQLNVR